MSRSCRQIIGQFGMLFSVLDCRAGACYTMHEKYPFGAWKRRNTMMLETERLLLRPWTEADAPACFRYAKDPRVGPRAGWLPHKDEAESREIIRDVLSVPETFAIIWKETGLPIGCVGLNFHTYVSKGDDEAELGYWLGVPWWGRGIMPEAARALLLHGFADIGLERIWCCYFAGNEQSKRVQEKLGFRYQRTIENIPIPRLNETRDDVVNLLTREEWMEIAHRENLPK